MTTKNALYFEELGDDFNRFISEYDTAQRIRWIVASVSEFETLGCSQILEVGCGTGRITEALTRAGYSVLPTDISPVLTEQVSRRLGLEGKSQDATSLDFEDSSFKCVVSSECIEHTSHPKTAVREMLRVLEPGGVLILTTPNKIWYPVVWATARLAVRRFKGPENFMSRRELRAVARGSGAIIRSHDGLHLLPWQIPGAKKILPIIDTHAQFLRAVMINQCIVVEKR